jgi:hypothetical protein
MGAIQRPFPDVLTEMLLCGLLLLLLRACIRRMYPQNDGYRITIQYMCPWWQNSSACCRESCTIQRLNGNACDLFYAAAAWYEHLRKQIALESKEESKEQKGLKG